MPESHQIDNLLGAPQNSRLRSFVFIKSLSRQKLYIVYLNVKASLEKYPEYAEVGLVCSELYVSSC